MTVIQRIACGHVNCYLVTEKGNSILIDTAQSKYREKLYQICKEKQVRLIVLTHGHIDHIENAAYLSNCLQVPIAMHSEDTELIETPRVQTLHSNGMM